MGAFVLVGLGGALGAIGRYAISLFPTKSDFPILTLLTNLMGALLIGFIIGLSLRKELPKHWLLFWKAGICGGFTTFSTFSLEALQLFESGKTLSAALYVILSLLLCLMGVSIGRWLAFSLFKP